MNCVLAYLLFLDLFRSEHMTLEELLAAFQAEANGVVSANQVKSDAAAALAAAQEALTAANGELGREKTEARAALDAVIAKLNEMADQLGI